MVTPWVGAKSLDAWMEKPATTGGMISSYACRVLNVPESTSSAAVNALIDELIVAFRHMHSVGVLSGMSIRSGGDMVQFQTNGFTPRFLRFVLDPF